MMLQASLPGTGLINLFSKRKERETSLITLWLTNSAFLFCLTDNLGKVLKLLVVRILAMVNKCKDQNVYAKLSWKVSQDK